MSTPKSDVFNISYTHEEPTRFGVVIQCLELTIVGWSAVYAIHVLQLKIKYNYDWIRYECWNMYTTKPSPYITGIFKSNKYLQNKNHDEYYVDRDVWRRGRKWVRIRNTRVVYRLLSSHSVNSIITLATPASHAIIKQVIHIALIPIYWFHFTDYD